MAKKVTSQVRENLVIKNSVTKSDLFSGFLALLLALSLLLASQFLYSASVNGQLISRLSVIKELEKQGGKSVLDSLILQSLINQEAKKRKLTVTEEELNGELSKIESNIASQGATLEELLKQQGMVKKDLEEQISLQLLVTKMVDDKVTVSEEEIDEYLTLASDLTRDQAKETISQQRVQEKIQIFLEDLKSKAKITYFIKY